MKKLIAALGETTGTWKGWLLSLLVLCTVSTSKAAFVIWADTVSGSNGSQVDVSVKVKDFSGLISAQGTLQWNTSIATYVNTNTYGLPGLTASSFGTGQTGTGRLTFSWNDATLAGVSVPNNTTIFRIRFNLVGAGGTFTLVNLINSPTALEFIDLSFSPIAFSTLSGRINVTGGAPSCAITAITAGTQTACVPATNTYTQQVTVTYSNPPGSGNLVVNGQSFAITASPQTVTLTGLTANAAAVNVTASFSASAGCTMTANNLFTAPASCAASSGNLVITADTVSGNNGSQVIITVRARNFTNITSAQGTLNWNTSVATYSAVPSFGLPSMSISNFGTSQVGTGRLTFSWNDPTLAGVTLANGATVFTVRFNIVGTAGSATPVSWVNVPTPMEFVDNNFAVLPFTSNNGRIVVNGVAPGLVIKADSVSGTAGGTVDLPIRARDFINLTSAQGTLSWNTAVATYNSVVVFGLPSMSISNFGVSQVGTGKLTFSWNDPTLAGVTVANNAILFTVRFNLVGSAGAVTPVDFVNSPTSMEFVDNAFNVVPFTSNPGQITILGAGNTISTGTISGSPFCAGAAVSVPFTITGVFTAGNVFTAQLSDASGSFASPVSIGTLTGTTSGTISATIPPGTVTGTGYRIRVVSSTPVVTGSNNGVNITINAIPATPTISAGGPTTFCAGGSVVLTSSSATGNVWSPGGQTTQSITVTTAGTYSVVVTTAGCSSAPSAGTTVTVNAPPATPTITPGGPTTFCTGGSVVLTSSSATGNVWTPGGATTQSITATTSGSYTVQVTGGNGCTATSAPTVVTVNANPATPTITPGGPTTFCTGGSVVLTSSATTGNVWTPGGATTQSITATAAGSYTVQVTNVNGCSATSAPTVVTVNAAPAAPVISAGGPTTFCAGGSVVLTSTSATNNVWSPGGQTTQSITVNASGTYTCVVNNGCASPASNAITVTVNANPATPTITPGGPTTFCTGGSVVLTSSATTGNVWTPGGATTQSITASTSGSYTVQVTNVNGCSATSAPTVVTVTAAPAAPVISAGGPTTFCAGGSVVLTSNSATNNVWSPGGQTTQSITVNASGTYTCVVNNGCASPVSNAITVTVNANPATPTITPGGPTTFCTGGSVVLTSSATTGNVWTPGGATTQAITASTSGSYTVQVTNVNGCSATSAPTVVTVSAAPAAPVISAGGPATFCAGGSVVLTSNSATNNVWSPGGQTTQSITVNASGTYTCIVNNGCPSPASNAITVTVNPLPSAPTITPGGPTTFCAGGSVTLTSSSATGNLWTPGGATTQSITATTSGNYTVQFTDGNGCSATSAPTAVTVNANPATPTITPGGPTTFCTGGSVVLTSSATTGNVWTPGGATTQSITASTSGSYTVQVTNVNGCSATSAPTVVTVTAAPAAPVISAGGPTTFCAGGSVVLTSTSATNNVWSPGGQTTQSITVTASGTYTCVVNNGCASPASNAITVTVNANPATPTITPGGPTSFCTGGSVVLTSSATTGNVWTPGGATTQSITASTSGSYTVQVTNVNGCSATSAPTVVTVSAAPAAPVISAGGPTTFCTGGNVVLTSNSATNNVWSPGGQTTQSITVTASGTYTCVVNNGCPSPVSNAITVTVNPLPATPTITPGGPTSFCTGGSVVLTSSATSGNTWTPGGATTQAITASTSGSYTVQVTDGNGCSATSAPTVVTVSAAPAAPVISAGGPTTFCAGGSVVLTSTSATNNVWSPGGQTTQSITVTAAGTYTCVVNNGCPSPASNAITVTVNALPAAPTITPGGPTTFCAGGSVTLTSSSATGNLWTPGGATTQAITATTSGSYTVQFTDGNGCSATSAPTVVTVNALPATPTITPGGPTTFCTGGSVVLTSSATTGNVWTPGGATTQSITATAAGSYTVQVTNVNGCSATSAPTVVTVTAAPAAPVISAGSATTFCAGGSVVLTSTSATNNVWSPGGQTTQSITVTASGTYTCVVNSGCPSPASNAITVTVNPLPATPVITPGGPTTFCTGGSVVLTSSSTTGNVWTPGGATTQSITVTNAGSYTVQVTNGNGCSATSAPTVVTVNPVPATPTIGTSGPTTFCQGGSVTLTSSSPTGNVWTPGGQTTQSITVNATGTYGLTVTSGGCTSAPVSVGITVNANPATPIITPSGPTTFCTGGSVVLTSSATTGNLWTPGGATTQSITATTSGSYTVQVTNVNGCSATSAPTVVTVNSAPAAPVISAAGPTTFCAGGSVTLTSTSATNNVWSPGGQTTQSITVNASGTYTCVVNNGCASPTSNAITVTVNPLPSAPTVTAGGPTTFCAGGSVTLTSSATAGNLWTPGGATTQTITATSSGSYTVQFTDANGCSATSAPTVVTVNPIPATPTITPSGSTAICAGGSVTLTSSSASGNVWSPGGQTTPSITVSAAGTYSVTVTTAGCSSAASAPVTVTLTPAAVAGFTSAPTGLSVAFTNTSTNATTYSWNFGDGSPVSTLANPTHTYAVGGVYNVCLTATNACGSNVSCQNITLCVTPTAAFTSNANNLSVAFTDASTGSPTAWAWDFGDGATSTLQNPSHNFAGPGTYNVCLTVTNACGTTTSCVAVTVVCPAPVSMFSFAVLGNTVNFTIQSSSGVPATYSWDFGDGQTSTSFNPSHTYTAGGNYTVCLTVTDVCGTDTHCDTVSIFCPGPVADFNWSTVGFTVDFQDVSTNNPTQWSWDFGDGGSSTLQNPTHTYAAVGPYVVCLTAINNCDTNISCKVVNDLVGVKDPARQLTVTVFPNPTQDLVTVQGLGQVAGNWRVEIVDMFGRQLIVRDASAGNALLEELSLRELAAGMYLVKVTKGSSATVVHLVKE